MAKTLICGDCNASFLFGDAVCVVEPLDDIFQDRMGATFFSRHCPHCFSDYLLDATQCKNCGKVVQESSIIHGLCSECANDAIQGVTSYLNSLQEPVGTFLREIIAESADWETIL